MLAKLQRLWIIVATKYTVLPIDDRSADRNNPDIAGRPTLIRGSSQQFFPGMGRLSENSVVSIKNESFSVTVEVPDGGVEGVIIAQGGRFGGWAVYTKGGKVKFVYNVLEDLETQLFSANNRCEIARMKEWMSDEPSGSVPQC